MCAFTPLSTSLGQDLCSQQPAGLAGEGAGRDRGIWGFPGAAGLGQPLLSLLLLLLWLGAGGAVSVGSWQAGGRQLLAF